MSIDALTNAAAARRPDFAPLGKTPDTLQSIARAASTTVATADGSSSVNTALQVLFGYIPTEVLTLYVAALGAHTANAVTRTDWILFWSFLAATPIVVWLVYAAKIKATQKPIPVSPGSWPMWEMTAATIGYFAWAFALPGTPFSTYGWYSSALAGVAVLAVSAGLGLLAPFFQRELAI